MKTYDQNRAPLFEALKAYHSRNVIPFDVPGHKHGKGLRELAEFLGDKIMEIDVNSMDCLDNICNPIGVIKEAELLAANAYGAEDAFFLVNGTSSGVQAMIMSVCKPGDKIILPRNAHKSTIGGIILSGAVPVYIQPEINEDLGVAMGVTVDSVRKIVKQHPDAKAIFLINPTYYGATSNIKAIVKIARRYGMTVLVDEAHGAHLSFHKDLPKSGIDLGADLSAASTHKTGGSLTQSSLLLLKSNKISSSKVKQTLNLTQTTSGSYLLMVSIDVARKQLATKGEELLGGALELSRYARHELNKIDGVHCFGTELIGTPGVYNFDETKLGINVRRLGLSGYDVYKILLKDYNIQVEMGDLYNILAIVSLGDTKESVQALIDAVKDMAQKYRNDDIWKVTRGFLENPEVIVSPRNAYYSSKKDVPLEESEGEISAEMVMAYPPGIPVIGPGERITQEIIEHIQLLKDENCSLQGTADPYVNTIRVLGQE
jgi:arginine decarboxylase